MATLDKILEAKTITRVTVRLARGQFDERKFYAYPDCLQWMKTEVPKMVTGRIGADNTPAEQLIQRLVQWIVGKPMAEGRMFRDMRPKSDHVWELKTPDLRIFGWLCRPREFIAVCGGYADDYKEPTIIKDYEDDRRAVLAARDALPLDGDKFARGEFHGLV